MVTRNAGDGRSRDNYNRNTGEKREYRGNYKTDKKDYKPSGTGSNYKPSGTGSNYKPSGSSSNYKPSGTGSNYKPSGSGSNFKSGEFNKKDNYKRNDNYKKNYGNPYDKDRDDDTKNPRERSKASAAKDSKTKEQQIAKVDIINRLEKEKKAVERKKNENVRKAKEAKPQLKLKRVNNIDWTKEYENDSFDDDDMDLYL